ncbi:MAG: hypothetical protein Unbinned5081contig1002_54 [Prokaryotic dsDNA virus sp.]|nr:MAG: hypothetical protein Unbinned5081contig1002_54 [Prokaryotic dsDNA virus sp.]|tara:strand:+ start:18204 stop:18887 length:684 start_codon:yes stop_codon:yes gene_type:complete
MTENKRRIVVLGTGPGAERAPIGKDGVELWGLTGHWNSGVKFDRIYELHSAKTLTNLKIQKPKGDWMWKNVTHIHPTLKASFPDAKVFDFEKYLEKYGRVFSCSMAWMLADAIEEKPEVIEIYGVTLSSLGEYKNQKPSFAAFALAARVLGIKVVVDRESELFSVPWLYGYEDEPDYMVSLRDKKKQIRKDMAIAESEVFEVKAKFNKLEGLNEAFEWFENNYHNGQ